LGILSNFPLENGLWTVGEINLTVIYIFIYNQAEEMAQLSMKNSHLLSLLSTGYRGLFFFSRGKVAGAMMLTSHIPLMMRSRKVELYFHSPICLHDIVLN
jgi:hypothetical protein